MESTGSIPPIMFGDAYLGNGRLVLIAGPCVIESESHARSMAENIKRIADTVKMPFIFKASYDKANRSSLDGFRGPGPDAGLKILSSVKSDLAIPVLSDIHSEAEVNPAAEVLDILQIPAFLCRQTDLLIAAGKSGKSVNIKKGQFMAPWNMRQAIDKVKSTGNKNIAITERGTCFGYNNLVTDMRGLPIMRSFGIPVIFDATHSVQLPGGRGNASGGEREMAYVLARAAVAAGVDGIFLEVHDNPDLAKCDGPNMIPLDRLQDLLETLLAIQEVIKPGNNQCAG